MNTDKMTQEIVQVSETYFSQYKIKPDDNWYVLKLQEELGELIQSFLMMTGKGRTKGKSPLELKKAFHKEVADVFAHVLLIAKHFEVDVSKELEEKWLTWNKSTRLTEEVLKKK